MNLNYSFSNKTKRVAFVLMAIGLVSLLAGYILDHAPEGHEASEYHHTRFWANILVNGFFFMGISLAMTFFLAVQYAAEAGWATSLKRVFEAITSYLPYGLSVIFLVLITGQFQIHHLYHWMNPEIYDKTSEHYDKVIAGKQAYFTPWFFWLRSLSYMIIWILFQRGFRKRSLEADLTNDPGWGIHDLNIKKAAIFLIFFGVTSSTASWDWLMSIDTHWFSTMFGWYTFAGMWISAMVTTVLLTIYLKRNGYLEQVNESVIHDMGKWVFAVSFLWSYLWFAQFMLIWYTNIPEEVTYYIDRIYSFGYRGVFFTMFFINFALPMIMLISRDAKRNYGFLTFVGCVIIVGHWLDVFCMVMPATLGSNWHLAWFEIGTFLGFVGLFIFVVLKSLSEAPLIVKAHPFIEESKHHSI